MSDPATGANRYPTSLRILHWIRAVLILGLVAVGLTAFLLAGRGDGVYQVGWDDGDFVLEGRPGIAAHQPLHQGLHVALKLGVLVFGRVDRQLLEGLRAEVELEIFGRASRARIRVRGRFAK